MILLVKWASKIPSWKVSYDIQALKWSIWDYGTIFRIFTEIPQFHVKCWKLPNTNISVRDVENWHPGHRKMQVYWFASIILSKIALIGLQGVKWWIWAFLRFYGLYAFNAYGVNLRKYGWSLKKFMLCKCQKDMGFCFGW